MMDAGFDFSIIWSLFGGLLSLAVFGICIYYIIAKQSADSILLVIGAFIQLLTSLFYSIGNRILMNGADFYSNSWIFTLVGVISFIGGLCFTAGLIILIINHVKQHKAKQF